jgi:hypothetical protein
MKKFLFFSFSVVGASLAQTHAASYLSDFSGLALEQALDGVDGWTQSHPNETALDELDNLVEYPWAYGTEIITSGPGVTPVTTTPAAAVGGYYNTTPTVAGAFYASHSLSLEKGMLFQMRFALNDSEGFYLDGDPTLYGGQRNSFRISFYDAAYEVFALVFDPNPNPTALTDTNDSWNVSSSSGGVQTSPTMAVFQDQLYTLNLSLLPRSGNLNYFYSLSSDNTANGQGALTGLTGQIDSMRIGIDPTAGEYGTNQLMFEGIAATAPEPSSFLLLAVAGSGLILRRRRL